MARAPTLVDAATLAIWQTGGQAGGQPLLVLDCSFDLMQPQAGHAHYLQAHIPGAQHVDLAQDLSAAPDDPAPASGGRHPLPSRARFAETLTRLGVSNATRVVLCDRSANAWCARLWWMLRWAGHGAVHVLDGGLLAWQAAGLPVQSGTPPAASAATPFVLGTPLQETVRVEQVQQALGTDRQTIVDARAPERFRGALEPIDPVAGHIPGALNRPFTANLTPGGCFQPAAVLRAEWEQLLSGRDPASVVHSCGSGVSAAHNVLAMHLAGFAPTRLFAGSWSEWCSDPARPVARA